MNWNMEPETDDRERLLIKLFLFTLIGLVFVFLLLQSWGA